jgi:hypothetical protein
VIGGIVGSVGGEERRNAIEAEAEKRATTPVDVDSKEGREATLNKLVQQEGQNGQLDPDSENKCNATAILAGALRAGGREGLTAVLNDVNKDKNGNPIPEDKMDPQTKALMEKAKDPNSQLTQDDLNKMKDKLYDKMRESEGDKKTEYKKDANGNVVWDNSNGVEGEPVLAPGQEKDPSAQPGVNRTTTDNFINNDPVLKKMFEDSHQRIDHINNNGGSGAANHVVLEQDNKDGSINNVFDPYMRKDGNQVITDPEQLKLYQDATRNHT